jgi:hypothetical protein
MLMDVHDAAAGMISFAHFASPDGSIPRSLRQLHETLFYASRMRTNLPPRRYTSNTCCL